VSPSETSDTDALPVSSVTGGFSGDDGQSYFVEEAQAAAHEYGSAVAALQYLGVSGPTFDQVVDFIEKYRDYSAKAFADQEAANLRIEERRLQLERDKSETEAKAAERQLQLVSRVVSDFTVWFRDNGACPLPRLSSFVPVMSQS